MLHMCCARVVRNSITFALIGPRAYSCVYTSSRCISSRCISSRCKCAHAVNACPALPLHTAHTALAVCTLVGVYDSLSTSMVWYGMVEVCEGAPVAVSGWVLADRHDLHVLYSTVHICPRCMYISITCALQYMFAPLTEAPFIPTRNAVRTSTETQHK